MNITYESDWLAKYYSMNRRHWDEFYESEKIILSRFMDETSAPFSVLDVGCGCGGLGQALSEKYKMSMYCGVDINRHNIETAKASLNLDCPVELVCKDVAKMENHGGYDFVISFSCIDYNIDVEETLSVCWMQVKPGGRLILSVRLTNETGVNDIEKSYQPVGNVYEPNEIANYVVFNINDFFQTIRKLPTLGNVTGYGYWGAPSKTAHTLYSRLCFSVFCLEKQEGSSSNADLHLPLDLFS